MDGNSLMNNESLIEMLREKHSGSFEGWDGFETSIQLRDRKGQEPQALVILYNESKTGMVVDRHICFLISSDEDGQDIIEVGPDLNAKFEEAYYPGDDK
jgi:hypothetical protein